VVHQENELIVTYQNNLRLSSPTLLFANGDGTPDITGRRRFSLKLSDFDLGSKQRFSVGASSLELLQTKYATTFSSSLYFSGNSDYVLSLSLSYLPIYDIISINVANLIGDEG